MCVFLHVGATEFYIEPCPSLQYLVGLVLSSSHDQWESSPGPTLWLCHAWLPGCQDAAWAVRTLPNQTVGQNILSIYQNLHRNWTTSPDFTVSLPVRLQGYPISRLCLSQVDEILDINMAILLLKKKVCCQKPRSKTINSRIRIEYIFKFDNIIYSSSKRLKLRQDDRSDPASLGLDAFQWRLAPIPDNRTEPISGTRPAPICFLRPGPFAGAPTPPVPTQISRFLMALPTPIWNQVNDMGGTTRAIISARSQMDKRFQQE